jgi:type III secretion system FlhB-like substrate exporter
MQNLGARLEAACPVGDRERAWLDALRVTVDGNRTVATELIDDHATTKVAVDEGKTAVDDLIDRQAENKIAIDELIDDHETFRVVVAELVAWAEAVGAKLNADAGVTDEDYDADITAAAPAVLSAGDPTAITASKPTAGPDTLSAADPDAAPAVLEEFE